MSTQPDALTADEVEAIRERWGGVPEGPWESHYRYRLLHHHDWLMTCQDGRQLIFAAEINTADNRWAEPDAQIQVALAAAPDDIATLLTALATATQERDTLREMNAALELFTLECIKFLKGESDREKLRYALCDLNAKTDNIEQRLASQPASITGQETAKPS